MDQNSVTDLGQDMSVEPASIEKNDEMVPKSRVNEIVHKRTAAAYEKGHRDALQTLQVNSPQPQVSTPMNTGSSMGGMQQFSPDELRKIIAEETHKNNQKLQEENFKQMQQQEGERLAKEFNSKIEAGENKYPELTKKVYGLGLDRIPHIVHIANMMDNTADIMHELAENPGKIGSLHSTYSANPQLALIEMRRLSDSIKANQGASHVKSVNEPLSQINPSTAGTDNGSMSIRDFKKADWLRG